MGDARGFGGLVIQPQSGQRHVTEELTNHRTMRHGRGQCGGLGGAPIVDLPAGVALPSAVRIRIASHRIASLYKSNSQGEPNLILAIILALSLALILALYPSASWQAW